MIPDGHDSGNIILGFQYLWMPGAYVGRIDVEISIS